MTAGVKDNVVKWYAPVAGVVGGIALLAIVSLINYYCRVKVRKIH